MITIIYGYPGAGKTALMTCMALKYMTGKSARQDVKKSVAKIAAANSGGFNLNLPDTHLVFADYLIETRRGTTTNYMVNGFNLGFDNDQNNETVLLPPFSHVFLDEGQTYYNSRDKMPDFASRYYERHRHWELDIVIAAQRLKLIDLNVRDNALQILYIANLEKKFDHGKLCKTTWSCYRFENNADAEAFIDTGRNGKNGEQIKFEYEGDVFKHYDSHFFAPLFLKGHEQTGFDLRPASRCNMTVAEVIEFGRDHDTNVPKSFRKKG